MCSLNVFNFAVKANLNDPLNYSFFSHINSNHPCPHQHQITSCGNPWSYWAKCPALPNSSHITQRQTAATCRTYAVSRPPALKSARSTCFSANSRGCNLCVSTVITSLWRRTCGGAAHCCSIHNSAGAFNGWQSRKQHTCWTYIFAFPLLQRHGKSGTMAEQHSDDLWIIESSIARHEISEVENPSISYQPFLLAIQS